MKKQTTPKNIEGNTFFARRLAAMRKHYQLRKDRKKARANLRGVCGRVAMALIAGLLLATSAQHADAATMAKPKRCKSAQIAAGFCVRHTWNEWHNGHIVKFTAMVLKSSIK